MARRTLDRFAFALALLLMLATASVLYSNYLTCARDERCPGDPGKIYTGYHRVVMYIIPK